MDRKAEYSIVAYGDSLTWGTRGDRDSPAPYTAFLDYFIYRYLKAAESPFSVSIVNVSLPAGMIVNFAGKEGRHLGFHNLPLEKVLQERPDACIVLGGTNNLGMIGDGRHQILDESVYKKVEEVAHDLFAIYEQLREHSIEPVPVTVPPLRVHSIVLEDEGEAVYWRIAEFAIGVRHLLNRFLFDYSKKNGIHVVDLFQATSDPIGQMRREYSAGDWLHFNEVGYFYMARTIFEQGVKPHLDKWMGLEQKVTQ